MTKQFLWNSLRGVGQTERLACRERQPTRFPGRSPDPLCGQGPKTEKRKAALPVVGVATLSTRRSCPGPSGERTNTTITPVWPCEPLCAPFGARAESLPLPDKLRPTWAAVPGHFGTEVSPSRPLFRGRNRQQEKAQALLLRLGGFRVLKGRCCLLGNLAMTPFWP